MSEKIQQMLHVKSEDLRLYNITADENSPQLLEDETATLEDTNFTNTHKAATKDGFKLLVESKSVFLYSIVFQQGGYSVH